ncbi:MAG TPA: hypothetical protein PK308_00360 [Phycisphaerales bacterium]|nr:hypothetical protein [Phycisphaerales bacterium]
MPPCRPRPHHVRYLAAAVSGYFGAGSALAIPQEAAWPVDGPDDTVAVAAAGVSGWYATADAYEDNVEIRDVRGNLLRSITRDQILSLAPWMALTGGPDGPAALAFTDSGRQLFILVTDSALPFDGLGSDVILRYDAPSNTLSLFARLEANASEASFPHLSMVHFKGALYVGTTAGVRVVPAGSNASSSSVLATVPLPDGGTVRGLTVDRDNQRLYAASPTNIYRSNLSPLSWTLVGAVGGASGSEIRAITFADHFGSPSGSQRGLYVLRDSPSGALPHEVRFVPALQAQGSQTYVPTTYLSHSSVAHDLCATPDGAILLAQDEDAARLTDSSDTRLSFDGWIADEFGQHLLMARGLISPAGQPGGWVIDGDVEPSSNWFHPATPDAAAWTVLMLIAADEVWDDALARPQARSVLERYAGLAGFPAPQRTSDGLFPHWIQPANGQIDPGWGDGYATLSTMKLVAAASRAWSRWPDDPRIVRAASRIVFGVRNWANYTPSVPVNGVDGLYFNGQLAGGPAGIRSSPYNEGIIFVEQAGEYAGGAGASAFSRWIDRSLWPTATSLSGYPVTGDSANNFQSAFLSLYPLLLTRDYRDSTAWRTQVQNLRWSHAAWTDDNAPQYYTVFSAGTTPGGYNADSLSSHADDITTFTSLIALSAASAGVNTEAELVAAYHAYRKGARQAFKTGASLLYRRSNTIRSFTPNSCGLPDVSLAGLALAEALQPGFIDSSLAIAYPDKPECPLDVSGDGLIDAEDLYSLFVVPADPSGDGAIDQGDVSCLLNWLRKDEPQR